MTTVSIGTIAREYLRDHKMIVLQYKTSDFLIFQSLTYYDRRDLRPVLKKVFQGPSRSINEAFPSPNRIQFYGDVMRVWPSCGGYYEVFGLEEGDTHVFETYKNPAYSRLQN